MSGPAMETRRNGKRVEFRGICTCGASTEWVATAGLVHGWIGEHTHEEEK